jgi:hypothetical protein
LALLSCKTFFAREKPRHDWDLQDLLFTVPANQRQLLDSKQPEMTVFSMLLSNPMGKESEDNKS